MQLIEKVKEVNSLLREAFGKRCAGNFLDACSSCGLIETDRLEVIGDNGIPLFGSHFFGHIPFFPQKVIGKFGSKDGSSVRVIPEYAEQAKRYAEAYRERFGKEVKVTIDNQANLLFYVDAFA